MAKFDAGSVVDPLEYDFTTVTGYKHRTAKGTIPEPSEEKIAAFLTSLRDTMKDTNGADVDLTDPSVFLAQLDQYDPDKFLSLYRSISVACAELCSGHPTAQQISDLPLRIRMQFFKWLFGEVMSPEAKTGAGIAEVTPLRSAVAG